jgi:hypothetical protein
MMTINIENLEPIISKIVSIRDSLRFIEEKQDTLSSEMSTILYNQAITELQEASNQLISLLNS